MFIDLVTGTDSLVLLYIPPNLTHLVNFVPHTDPHRDKNEAGPTEMAQILAKWRN